MTRLLLAGLLLLAASLVAAVLTLCELMDEERDGHVSEDWLRERAREDR